MKSNLQTQSHVPPQPKPAAALTLQRKCACGKAAGLSNSCEECGRRKLLQRRAADNAAPPDVQPVVDEVLNSSGQPLDASTRTFMESRFGHDFSRVRIHADGRAAESAQAVNAIAYTVGHNVVLGAGSVGLPRRQRGLLLAHELAHVVQQQNSSPSAAGGESFDLSRPGDASEREADDVAERVMSGARVSVVQAGAGSLQRKATAKDEKEKDERTGILLLQQERVYKEIGEGLNTPSEPAKGPLDPGNLFRNTSEFINNEVVSLAVLAPTHDSETRNPQKGEAHFDPLVTYPRFGSDYPADPDVKTDKHLVYATPAERGRKEKFKPSVFLFTEADSLIAPERIRNVLVHEVQHAADQHEMGKAWTTSGTFLPQLALDETWSRYQSEFRAYWVQPRESEVPSKRPIKITIFPDEFGAADQPAENILVETRGTVPAGCTQQNRRTNFKNKRQSDIFRYLSQEDYGFDNFYVCNDKFSQLVDNFSLPYGGNLVNSVRIQALSDAIEKCKKTMSVEDPEIAMVRSKAEELDEVDRKFLFDETLSGPFWKRVRALIPSELLLEIRSLILFGHFGAGDFPVPRGDTRAA